LEALNKKEKSFLTAKSAKNSAKGAKKFYEVFGNVPQRLKPQSIRLFYGTTEVVPFPTTPFPIITLLYQSFDAFRRNTVCIRYAC
jgi:hypothetical protein